MLGYLFFAVPMTVAFIWIARGWGVRQALLDLIAFNVLFNFDFGALLPGSIGMTVLDLLLLGLLGYEFLNILVSGRAGTPVRVLVILAVAGIFVTWLVVAAFLNKEWDLSRTTVYVVHRYIFTASFIFVGMRLAKGNRLARFGKILFTSSVLVGLISMIQTASRGAILTNDRSDSYLGIFQPLGGKAIALRDLNEATMDFTNVVRTIQFGGYSFYRAPGTYDVVVPILCVVAIIAFCLLTNRAKSSFLLFVPLVLSLIGIVVAFNRTAVVAFATVGAAVSVVRLRSLLSRRMIARWAIPILAIAVAALLFIQPISTVVAASLDGFFGTRAERDVGSLNGRTLLWANILPDITSNLLIGTGKPITLAKAGWGTDDNPEIDVGTHNGFLEYAYRGGIVPAAIFVLLLGFCLTRSLQLSRSKAVPADQRAQFFALAAATAGFVLLSVTMVPMYVVQVGALFWVGCGYLAAYRVEREYEPMLPS